MSTYACKLLSNTGATYVAFNTTIDQFVSTALPSVAAVAKVVGDDEAECEAAASTNIFDLRKDAVHRAVLHLSKLKLGKSLRTEEACELRAFEKFLNATVAPHQWDYPEISDESLNAKIEQLGLRKHFPDYDCWEIVTDCAMYPAFKEAAQRIKFPKIFSGPRKRPLVGQNRLAGWYVSQLVIIANIVGPEKSTPEAVVERFYKVLQTKGTGALS